jgi:hypothetical protein
MVYFVANIIIMPVESFGLQNRPLITAAELQAIANL